MIKMTSAYANKLLKKLNEDMSFWLNRENEGSTYIAAVDETPIIPEYDYSDVTSHINDINDKIARIKHAINVNNVNNRIPVGDTEMSVDEILVKMAQLNRRKCTLDVMRKQQPKSRINNSSVYSARKLSPEYQYINYDPNKVNADYEHVDSMICEMQLALDRYNQTFEFEVEV
ncbi:MAG: hypothetical protein ACI4EU_01910 [Butyrivibrio sp.]